MKELCCGAYHSYIMFILLTHMGCRIHWFTTNLAIQDIGDTGLSFPHLLAKNLIGVFPRSLGILRITLRVFHSNFVNKKGITTVSSRFLGTSAVIPTVYRPRVYTLG